MSLMSVIARGAVFLLGSALWAAPQLRLSQTVVGPVAVTLGQNPSAQVVYASNVGDGSLNLRLTSNVSWVQTSVGAPTDCSLRGICLPITLQLQTSSLTAGMYTAIVAVSDPNAIDAPQTIAVTVQIGGGVPEKAEFNLTPNTSASARFMTTNPVNVAVSQPSGQSWLAVGAESAGSFQFGRTYRIAVNPGNLAAGDYAGQFVTTLSTLATENRTVPVALKVTPFANLQAAAAGAPIAFYGGVVNNATFEGDFLAPGGIVAVFGDGFVSGDPVQASALPLPTELGGVKVFVNETAAPVYYSSSNQINFQIPFETPEGAATVRVEKAGQRGNQVSIRVARFVPRLLRLNIADYGIIVNQDGSFPIPVTAGVNSRPARPGETLVIYALGLGQTQPAVTTGAGAPTNPLGRAVGDFKVAFGASGPFGDPAQAIPLFVGLTPNFVGLYQINVTIPENAPRGTAVPVTLESGSGSSNRVTIAIE